MYKTLLKHQNTFFSGAEAVLEHHKNFSVKKNSSGLNVLSIDGKFVASFTDSDYNAAMMYYGNRETQRNLNK